MCPGVMEQLKQPQARRSNDKIGSSYALGNALLVAQGWQEMSEWETQVNVKFLHESLFVRWCT